MALTTSLKRSLLVLFLLMALLMVFVYWNQNDLKPVSSLIGPAFDRSAETSPISADGSSGGIKLSKTTERSWTYKCIADRCVRQHFVTVDGIATERRIPFMTCSMTCGDPNIWPLPTGKVSLSTKALAFTTDHIKFKITSRNSAVESLFKDAFYIFLQDVRNSETSHEAEIHKNYDISSLEMEVHITSKHLSDNDVHLSMNSDESYNITVGHSGSTSRVLVRSHTFFGARNALATLQQMIWYDDETNTLKILSKALIEDAPKFKFRGLMLDTSRHFFSVESIKRTLIGMAHSKLNRFHWHITDSQSFPFVSRHYPELAQYGAYSSHEVYTVDDVKEVVDFARVRGIQVVPEIDAPAHAGNGWDWGPKKGLGELSLCINQQPWSFYCGEPPCGQLNPKNNNTYTILQKLYEELLELTGPTDYFHLGGDEVNLECWAQHFNDTNLRQLWCDFMLHAYNRLKLGAASNQQKAPAITTVWSSGLTSWPCLSKTNFAVQIWGGSTWQENYDLIDNGYNVIFSHVDFWYLDCGFGNWRSTGEGACSPYRTWQMVYKHRPWERMHIEPQHMHQVLGGEACLWTEQVDEAALDSRLWPRSSALAERLWTDPSDEHDSDVVPKEVFNRMAVFRQRLVDLGIAAEPIFPKYCAQNQDECI